MKDWVFLPAGWLLLALDNAAQHLDFPKHLVVDGVLLDLGVLVLIFVLGARLWPLAVELEPGALGALGARLAAAFLALATGEAPHSQAFGDGLQQRRRGGLFRLAFVGGGRRGRR